MIHAETQFQIQVVTYLRHAMPAEVTWFHVPNGGARDKREAVKLKAMGVRAGVPDLIFLHDSHWFAIELKAGKGALKTEQIAFRNRHLDRTFVCRSIDEVEAVLFGQLRLIGFKLGCALVAA